MNRLLTLQFPISFIDFYTYHSNISSKGLEQVLKTLQLIQT